MGFWLWEGIALTSDHPYVFGMEDLKTMTQSEDKSIQWEPSFSVKAKVLDSEHQRIFQILAELQAVLDGDVTRERLMAIFRELYDYSQTHFRNEETLLER